MKVKSTHTATISREELAERLGFSGTVIGHRTEPSQPGDYTFTVEGDVSPSMTVPVPPSPAPAPMAGAHERTSSVSSRAVLTIEFQYSDNDHGDKGEAYAEELKHEIQLMLARSPEPGITTSVALVFSG